MSRKSKIFVSGDPKHLTCENCGKQDETVRETNDPYEWEINEKEVDVTMCSECLYERAEEI